MLSILFNLAVMGTALAGGSFPDPSSLVVVETTPVITSSAPSVLRTAVLPQQRCLLGLSSAEECAYDPHNPSSYLSLGDALAAFGLIFAAYQLRRPQWDIVLRIRPLWQRRLPWIFVTLGLLFALLAAILPQLGLPALPLISYPLFYEIFSFIFFIAAPATFFGLAQWGREKLFTQASAKKFYSVLMQSVAAPTEDTLRACINVIGANLEAIAKLLPDEMKLWPRNVDGGELLEHERYAVLILSVIISEPMVAKYIATNRLDFLYEYIRIAKKHRLTVRHTGASVSRLVEELFENESSYLYTQLRLGGLSRAVSLFKILFFDQYILDNFGSLHEWNTYRYWDDQKKLLDEKYLDVFLEALEQGVRGYFFDESSPNRDIQSLWRAFESLASHGRRLASAATDRNDPRYQSIYSRLHKISSFLGTDIPSIWEEALQQKKVRDGDKQSYPMRNRKFNHEGFSSAYASGLYEFWEGITAIRDEDETLGDLARMATLYILSERADNYSLEGTRDCFTQLIWAKIDDNVTKKHYPEILRVYLAAWGFQLTGASAEAWEYSERTRLVDLLEKKLRPLLISGEKMRNQKLMKDVFLPTTIRFNEAANCFEHQDYAGNWKPIVRPGIKPTVTIVPSPQ